MFISITYNRKILDRVYDGRPYFAYLQSISTDSNVQPVKFDSIQLRADYVIPVNGKLTVEHGMGGRNEAANFMLIQEIAVRKGSSTIFYKHNMLDTSFKKTKIGEWQLEIK